jgi:hypothetical protein
MNPVLNAQFNFYFGRLGEVGATDPIDQASTEWGNSLLVGSAVIIGTAGLGAWLGQRYGSTPGMLVGLATGVVAGRLVANTL